MRQHLDQGAQRRSLEEAITAQRLVWVNRARRAISFKDLRIRVSLLPRKTITQTHLVLSSATAAYLVERTDSQAGSGANFVVQWSSPRSGARALMESVMIGSQDDIDISFSSRGINLPYPMPEQ